MILGPFAASDAWAKKTNVTDKINKTEITNLWSEAMFANCPGVSIGLRVLYVVGWNELRGEGVAVASL